MTMNVIYSWAIVINRYFSCTTFSLLALIIFFSFFFFFFMCLYIAKSILVCICDSVRKRMCPKKTLFILDKVGLDNKGGLIGNEIGCLLVKVK